MALFMWCWDGCVYDRKWQKYVRLLTHDVDELVTVSLLVVVIIAVKNLAVDSKILMNEKTGKPRGAEPITSHARPRMDAAASTRQEKSILRVLVCAFVWIAWPHPINDRAYICRVVPDTMQVRCDTWKIQQWGRKNIFRRYYKYCPEY